MNNVPLVIYTGGTIGSKPRDADPSSPQVVVSWKELKQVIPALSNLGFDVDAVSIEEPLDSCNIGIGEWMEIAGLIESNYQKYSGFVVLHGTDTLSYTASMLSFMLENLSKPVIVTGGLRSPMVDVRNDSVQNLITSLILANPQHSGLPVIPEVCVYLSGSLLRGSRAVKMDTSGFTSYQSPNFPLLAEIGDRIVINERFIRPLPSKPLKVHYHLNAHVTTIFIYPGVQNTDLVKKQLADPTLRAAIVLAFGTGNIPTDDDFLHCFKEATDRGILLINISQNRRGPVELGIYETSAKLVEMGFVSAYDIGLEAALCKLMVLLEKYPNAGRNELASKFQMSWAGEQSMSHFSWDVETPIDNEKGSSFDLRLRPKKEEKTINAHRIEKLSLRLFNLKAASLSQYPLSIGFTLKASGKEIEFNKYLQSPGQTLLMDLTGFLDSQSQIDDGFSFQMQTSVPVEYERTEAYLYVKEDDVF